MAFVVRGLPHFENLGGLYSTAATWEWRETRSRYRRAFVSRSAAEAHAADMLRKACLKLNPLAIAIDSRAAAVSSLDWPRLHDWLLDCGLPTPPSANVGWQVWYEWWYAHASELSEWQRLRAWEAFDRIKLYDVVEVELVE